MTSEILSSIAVLSLFLITSAGCARRGAALSGEEGPQHEEVFTIYSPLSRNAEILRRTLPPLTFRRGQQALADRGQALAEQSIDLAKETFAVYVPPGPPPKNGYGLLVFVSPDRGAIHPRRWRPPLDRHGLILVSAAGSGNEVNILDRRLPLAILAWENVRARYPIDPGRVFVGGLSGGSRVAQIAALAYPDVFRGALLNAGSEPISGERGVYLPPADLFERFQRMRIVFVTGEEDTGNLEDDQISQASLKSWCVFNFEVQIARRLGHRALDPVSLDYALDALEQASKVDEGELARCNARIQAELTSKLADAKAALARGDRDGARSRMKDIDARYGGLAGPALIELDEKLSARK